MANSPQQRRQRTDSALRENTKNGKPVNLDLDVFQAEAVREPFTVRLAGKVFTLPHMADLDWHTVNGADGTPGEATISELVKAGLGDQWAQFNDLKLTAGGYNKLWTAWAEFSGTDPGESGASDGSSQSTPGR